MEDEVSDEELAAKVGELFDIAPKVRKNLSKAAGEAQVAKQMEMGQAHLQARQATRTKVNNLIEEKKQSLQEGEEGEDDEDEAQEGGAAEPKNPDRFELNMDPGYWRKKFLYPFALDPAPLRLDAKNQKPEEIIAEKKRQKLLGDESILCTTKYQFPYNQIKKLEYFSEVQNPIKFTMEDIRADMHKYESGF